MAGAGAVPPPRGAEPAGQPPRPPAEGGGGGEAASLEPRPTHRVGSWVRTQTGGGGEEGFYKGNATGLLLMERVLYNQIGTDYILKGTVA